MPQQFPLPAYPIVFLAAAGLSFLMVFAAMLISRSRGIFDYPGHRQSHDQPTPTGGGIGIVASLVIAGIVLQFVSGFGFSGWLSILAGMVVLSLVGWIDDRKPLSSLFRLLVQFVVAVVCIASLATAGTGPAWLLAFLVFMVGFMNVYNFMDGSNGMAGFQGVFAGLVMAWLFFDAGSADLCLAAVLLAGSCAGFLPLNFPRARIFMGDSGSVPLGFCIAALLFAGFVRGNISVAETLLLLSMFLVDSGLTLFGRVIRGERWYTAHKQHIYQRLIGHGWSHSRVLLLYQAINIVLVVPALMLARMYPDLAWTIAGVMFLLASTGWYLASLRLGVRN